MPLAAWVLGRFRWDATGDSEPLAVVQYRPMQRQRPWGNVLIRAVWSAAGGRREVLDQGTDWRRQAEREGLRPGLPELAGVTLG